MTRNVILVGAGRHAMVLAETVIASPDMRLFGFVDIDPDEALGK